MKLQQEIATLILRLALGLGFLSAVASRLGFWGKQSSGWQNFINYTAQVNSFLQKNSIPALAIIATCLETCLGVLLLIGFKTNYVALAAAILTLLFAIAMSISFGIKEPLDYSVFAFCAAAFLLSTFSNYRWSIDQLF
jgi:putative oxidoreductase